MQGITSLTKCSAERYGDPSLFLSLLPCCPFLCHHHALPYHRPLISTSESQINTHEAVSPNQPSLFLTDNFKGLYHDRKLPICLSLLSTATSSSPCTAPPSPLPPPFLFHKILSTSLLTQPMRAQEALRAELSPLPLSAPDQQCGSQDNAALKSPSSPVNKS